MQGKAIVIGLVVIVLAVIAAIYFTIMATYKNNPTQKNQQSSEAAYTETASFGWQ